MLGARVQLKGWQQAAVAFGSAFGALLDPRRADLIAALGETTGKPAFERVLQRTKNNAEGRVNTYCPPLVCSSCPRPFVAAKSLIASVVAGFVNQVQNYHINKTVVYLFSSFENEITQR